MIDFLVESVVVVDVVVVDSVVDSLILRVRTLFSALH
jgi:hypothetical protein